MKPLIFISGVLISLLIGSCQKTERTREQAATQTVVTEPKTDAIIRDTVTNQEGVQLTMSFNNSNQTATFVWQGETINLKQDRMASGVKYSNAAYEFREHQGALTLMKGEKVVFSCKR